MRVIVIGGGIIGLAVAYKLALAKSQWKITLLEKEAEVGQHQSTHNSGVLHAGLYYEPGSAKARLAVSGIREMTSFARAHDVPHEICGKLVVATRKEELPRLEALLERGVKNGLRGIRSLSRSEINRLEPHCAGDAGIHVPEEGIIDYPAVCKALKNEVSRAGSRIETSAEVKRIHDNGTEWIVQTPDREFVADFIITCAGLYSDRVAELAGERRQTRIIPFRGEYFKLRESAVGLVRNLIYPVPDPAFPFLGVHFTRLIHGGVEAGPNAVLALSREGYRKSDVRAADVADVISFPGFWRFIARYSTMCAAEISRSYSRHRFADSLRRLVPELRDSDLEPGGAGVRAQMMSRDGRLVQDFSLLRRPRAMHVLNAPSPAATASLAIAGEIVRAVVAA